MLIVTQDVHCVKISLLGALSVSRVTICLQATVTSGDVSRRYPWHAAMDAKNAITGNA